MQVSVAATEAAHAWDDRVARENAQTGHHRDPSDETDQWSGFERSFAPPDRDEKDLDPAIPVLEHYLSPGDTILDVGAGGGRLAIPLAGRCAAVTAVEPSAAMRVQLEKSITALGVRNVEIVPEPWPETEVTPADHVICSHVLYATSTILPFVERLHDRARKRVTVMLRERPPQANFHPLWERLFGEERISLPAMPEFRGLLDAMGIEYGLHRLEDRPHGIFPDPETALTRATRRLFLVPGSASARRLEKLLPECLETYGEPGGAAVRLKWAEPQRGWLITWATC